MNPSLKNHARSLKMFRRRRFARKRIARRRITPRRYFRARKSLKIARNFVHSFTRTTLLSNLGSAGNNVVSSLITQFSTINGAAEFATLYKFYRINAVKWTFYVDQSDSLVGNTVTSPQLTTVVNRDINGGLAPSTESDLLQFKSARTKCLSSGIKMTVYVKNPSMDSNNSAVPVNMKKQWFPCYLGAPTLNNTQFAGMSYLYKGLDTNTSIRVYRKDYLQFKGMY